MGSRARLFGLARSLQGKVDVLRGTKKSVDNGIRFCYNTGKTAAEPVGMVLATEAAPASHSSIANTHYDVNTKKNVDNANGFCYTRFAEADLVGMILASGLLRSNSPV